MNIARHIEESALRYPNKEAIIEPNKIYTYKELNEFINRLAVGLNSFGLGKSRTLAILLPNSALSIALFYAGLKIGAVSICLNPMLKGEELNKILIDSNAEIFVTTRKPFETIENCSEKIKYKKKVVFADETKIKDGDLTISDLMLKGVSKDYKAIELDSDEVALIVYTSGTTGEPKGAVFTHGALMNSAKSLTYVLGEMTHEDKILNSAPLSSSMSIVAVLIPSIKNGASVYLQERFDPIEYVNLIKEKKITIIYAVPTIYYAINNICDLKKEDLKSLRFAACSGAHLPYKIRDEFEKGLKIKIVQAYGLTEATRILIADPAKGIRKDNSIGKPLPDVEIKIVDEEGNSMAVGQKGEICMRFPGGMVRYWEKPKETKKVLVNGWLHTGDIGYIDEDGYVYLIDRKTDKIIVGGYNVYPVEIENVFLKHSDVLEAAVVGYPDERLGEVPVAFVVMRDCSDQDGDCLIDFVKTQIANYKAPRLVYIEKKLPKNPVGKVLKRELKRKIEIKKHDKECFDK